MVRYLVTAPDIPFAKDDANRYLPWIIAFMLCLTGLMLAASLSIGQMMRGFDKDFSHSFTLQIPHEQAKQLPQGKMVKVIRESDWAESVREIDEKEMEELISPWLGSSDVLKSLPLPQLIEVRVKEDAPLDIAAFVRRVHEIAPGAEVDNYEQWMLRYGALTKGMQMLILVLALLVVTTTLGIVVLASKTTLRLHQQTVEVLYTIGATDHYIVRQFQKNAMWLIFRGAVFGVVAAVVLFLIAGNVTASFESPLIPVFSFSLSHAILFLLLPVVTAMAACITTQRAVMAVLTQKP